MVAAVTKKSPQQLLQDVWDLLAHEIDDIKARQAGGLTSDELEDASKRLDRLVRGINSATKNYSEYEEKIKASAASAADPDLVLALVKDPGHRAMFIKALESLGYTVTEAQPFQKKDPDAPTPKPKPKRTRVMRAPSKSDVKTLLSTFEKKEDQ